ncbi:hypothetical protein [Idiomarina sp.]|uniref:hypothetical protein n=1 Tax=Idiomarina sp. TaxID=1874361 RepID=UPI000C5E4684|nr:hypothetical protein [Idiomarina sp.]MAO66767.1 hypothetical protein [Idiomarina sp.]
MINTNYNSSFPDQVVPDAEKATYEYGLQVGRAIEGEWFRNDRGAYDRFNTNYNNFHRLRLYSRGEQSVQKYKDELSINGDLSYLNLDWKPVPVIPKFVDIVVNGMSQRNYEIKAFAQDPESIMKRTAYAEAIQRDMMQKQLIQQIQQVTGLDVSKSQGVGMEMESEEDLQLHMQMDYKESIEVAEEEVINNVLSSNKYDLTRRRLNHDLCVLGIAAVKTDFDRSEGVTVKYVDPASLVYSYTEDPNFEDMYYVGEVKAISLPELKKQFPYLTSEELAEIQKYPGNQNYTRNWSGRYDDNTVQVLYFEYKTYTNQVFKIKETANGLEKALEKTDNFNPPESESFKKAFRSIEVLYSGAKILGHEKMLRWEMAENMTRPNADTVKVNMNYNIVAPRLYKGRIESIVSRITGFADMIQLTHLKLQQVMSRIVPDGVYMDIDGLAEVDLGNGTNYNPAEALNMYFQTGSIVGRSMTQDGGMNPGKVPIQELATSNGMSKIQALIQTYEYYLKMIRDVTGLNEARDGTLPDKQSLVGLQKLAAASSNVATRHILQSSLYLTLRTCENISLRVADALAFPFTRQSLASSISRYNVGTLDELSNLNLHDFGVFLELEPDEEEKQVLEQNIQIALQGGQIDLEDAIDVREVNNLKLANQMLKKRRKDKAARDQQAQQANIQAQAQANAQLAEQTAMAEAQKQQILTEQKMQLEKAKSDFDVQKMEREAQVKMQLMEQEFNYNMQLAQMQGQAKQQAEDNKEDRKDERTKIQASQQSELIDQRKNDLLPKNFESSGNDNLGGFGLEQFMPR